MSGKCPIGTECGAEKCTVTGFGLEDNQVKWVRDAGFEVMSAEESGHIPFAMVCSGILNAANASRLKRLQLVLPGATKEEIAKRIEETEIISEFLDYDATRQAINDAVTEIGTRE